MFNICFGVVVCIEPADGDECEIEYAIVIKKMSYSSIEASERFFVVAFN